MIDDVFAKDSATGDLKQYLRSEAPGLQYLAVAADRKLFEYAGGWADIHGEKAMTLAARVKVVVASVMQPTAEYRYRPNAP